jgi:uncharacterized membrane protein
VHARDSGRGIARPTLKLESRAGARRYAAPSAAQSGCRPARERPAINIGRVVRGLPGHPLHPPLTDVTIGAYTFATIAGVLSKLGVTEHNFAKAWWLALTVALVSSALTVVSGVADWLTISRGSGTWKTATAHALTMGTATVCFVLAILFGHACYVDGTISTGPFILTLIGFTFLTAGGWLGGAITYVHGMRVLNLADEPAKRTAAPLPPDEQPPPASE